LIWSIGKTSKFLGTSPVRTGQLSILVGFEAGDSRACLGRTNSDTRSAERRSAVIWELADDLEGCYDLKTAFSIPA
jgi:hypothetical protein